MVFVVDFVSTFKYFSSPNKAGTHSIKQFSLTGCEINDLFSGCHQQNLPHFLSMSRYCLFFCIIPVS